jgi:D-alanine-D-alanine ligase
MNYIVLGGGTSAEKNVSNRSAKAVLQALVALDHSVILLDPATTTLEAILEAGAKSDGIFPILHGAGGEDGVLQAQFEEAGIAYFGPTSQACKNTFDKAAYKKIIEANYLPTPKWNVISAAKINSERLAKSAFVLKPISGGSSIDTFIVRTFPYDIAPLEEALNRYGTMLIEELIEGVEITVGVLGSNALPVIEIIPPKDKEFDYENKYNGATQELCPPKNVSKELQSAAQKLALAAHKITQCRHLSRTDIIINAAGEMFILETNTIPGLTTQSLFPKAAKAAGYSWVKLVDTFTHF